MSGFRPALLARIVAYLCAGPLTTICADEPIVVGSKNFTEGYLLAEIMAQSLEADGLPVERRFGFGGTKICFDALVAGEIDVYPEYTGTLRQVLIGTDAAVDSALADTLRSRSLLLLPSLGFNNTYAIAMNEDRAADLGIERISDLAAHDDLAVGFSHEFLQRPDGWPGLANTYELGLTPTGIEHGLAYQAIDSGKIDVTDAYSTDGELLRFGLRLLEDDRDYFPRLPWRRRSHEPTSIRAQSGRSKRLRARWTTPRCVPGMRVSSSTD